MIEPRFVAPWPLSPPYAKNDVTDSGWLTNR
jgi:hypothetical protein